MSNGKLKSRTMRFGPFELTLDSGELRKEGSRLKLSGQAIQVLELLLESPGQLVTREELQQKLWPGDTFGDFEHGLNAAVNRLRETLGDSASEPTYIETIPRRGYRFIGEISSDTQDAELRTPQADVKATAAPAQDSWPFRKAGFIAAVILAAACIGLLYHQYENRSGEKKLPTKADFLPVPFTSLQGSEVSPAFSPDGSHIVFAWNGGSRGLLFDLYVKVIGAESMMRLTSRPAHWLVPAWSPDGSTIAFARMASTPAESGIFSVPAVGGPERKLADAIFQLEPAMSLNWSSDGGQLTYADRSGMQILHVGNGELETLDKPSECLIVRSPVTSPNGKWLAFDCGITAGVFSIYVQPKGGPARPLTTKEGGPPPLAWSADSERLIFAEAAMWEVRIADGEAHRLLAWDASQPAISASASRLAYARTTRNSNIWALELERVNKRLPHREPLVSSTVVQRSPSVSPDGRKIAFSSDRSAREEIWICDSDGSNPVQLTNLRGLNGSPIWSPDGQRIAFDSRESGEPALYVITPQAGLARKLPVNIHSALMPTWSHDAKWIYFTSGESATGALYKVQAQGGEPVRVTTKWGINAQEATDGSLYFIAGAFDGEIRVIPASGGEDHAVSKMPRLLCANDWLLDRNRILFIDRTSQPNRIASFDLATSKITTLMNFDKDPEIWGGLAITPDRRRLLYSQVDEASSDIMLVENFR